MIVAYLTVYPVHDAYIPLQQSTILPGQLLQQLL